MKHQPHGAAPMRWSDAARYAWGAWAVVGIVLTAGAAVAWEGWRSVRVEAAAQQPDSTTPATPTSAQACPPLAAAPAAPLPDPTTVLSDLRRAPPSGAAQLADLRFERVLAAPGTSEQLQLHGVLQGSYAAGKDALKSVLERYPGAVLTSLRLQRPPTASPEVQWAFVLQFWALPASVSSASACPGTPALAGGGR